MRTCVLVVSYLRAEYLDWHFRSLRQIHKPDDTEIIVLNDGLEDETNRVVAHHRKFFSGLRYLFTGGRNSPGNMKWRVPGFALNVGIKSTDADILVLTCAEIFFRNDAMRLAVQPVQVDPGALGTVRVVDDHGPLYDLLRSSLGYPTPDALTPKIHEVWEKTNERYKQQDPFLANPFMPYYLAIRRQKLLDIGGYDEDFTGIGADDNDLVDRLQAGGCHYVHTEGKVIHLYHDRPDPDTLKNNPRYIQNCRIWKDRKGLIVRNQNRVWGQCEGVPVQCSICIATFNKSRWLDRTLQSIVAQEPPFSWELIVVDDGSSDDTSDICHKYPRVTYVRLDRPPNYRNPSCARNVAYRRARGDVIIAQSDDVVHVKQDTIKRLNTELAPGTFLLATVRNVDERRRGVPYEGYCLTGPEARRPFFFLGSLYRKDLYRAGGNDERYGYPGYDDDAFGAALVNGLGLTPIYSTIVGDHVDHPRPPNLGELVKHSKDLWEVRCRACSRGIESWLSPGAPWIYEEQTV